jgi:hypothetical protein
MRWLSFRIALILCTTLLPAGPARAAPPVLQYLYPAGMQRGTTATVTIAGTYKSWPLACWTDRPEIRIAPGSKRGQLRITTPAETPPGICWLRIHDEQGASNLRPFVIGTLPEVTEKETNDALEQAQEVIGSATVNGQLRKSGDVDVYAVALKKGQTLVASLQANHLLKSPMDGILQVVSEKGFVLEQNDDHRGLDPQIVFTAPSEGRYFVRLFAFPETPTSSIRFAGAENFVYRLTLTTAGFADHAYPLALPRGAPGKIEVIGWNIPAEARELPVPASTGEQVSVFHPALANPLSIRLEPHPTVVESKDNTPQHPQEVHAPVTITGQISAPGEVDAYAFTVPARQKVSVNIEAQALDSPLDPLLRLTDATGKVLKEVQSRKLGADPDLDASGGATTSFRLEVRDLHDRGGMRYVYRLRIAPPPVDYALKLKSDRFVLPPDKPLDIPITIERLNGFKQAIEIHAVDLPAGIAAKAVLASAGSKSAKLSLTREGKAIAGPFRIEGRVVKEVEPTHFAQAPVTEVAATTTYLWVTPSNAK